MHHTWFSGFGFQIWGLGFWVLGFEVRVSKFGNQDSGLELRDQCFWRQARSGGLDQTSYFRTGAINSSWKSQLTWEGAYGEEATISQPP